MKIEANGQRPAGGERRGFTMVELLAVITIIMILAGLVLGAAAWASRKGDLARCQGRMQLLKNALDEYKLDYGKVPQGSYTLLYTELFSKPLSSGRPGGERKPYISDTNFLNTSKQFVDPWGNYFRYQAPGARNKEAYDLWSFGPNGKDESGSSTGSDDLNNWSSGH